MHNHCVAKQETEPVYVMSKYGVYIITNYTWKRKILSLYFKKINVCMHTKKH